MQLFKYRWAVPIIAMLHKKHGGRYVSLRGELGMSRSMLGSTIETLIDCGLVIKNPGYGHPLRPELILTPLGEKMGPFCVEFVELVQKKELHFLLQNKWASPIIFKTGKEKIRFNEYKKNLKPITSRALSESLNLLVSEDVVTKKILTTNKVEITYQLPRKYFSLCSPYFNHLQVVGSYI